MPQVANKIDLIQADTDKWRDIKDEGYLPISATQNYGLEYLSERIERQILSTSDKVRLKMRLKPGSEEWEWLRCHSSIGNIDIDGDTNYNLVTVIISRRNLDKFKAYFVKS